MYLHLQIQTEIFLHFLTQNTLKPKNFFQNFTFLIPYLFLLFIFFKIFIFININILCVVNNIKIYTLVIR